MNRAKLVSAILILGISFQVQAVPVRPLDFSEVKTCETMSFLLDRQGRPVLNMKELAGRTLVARKVFQILDDNDGKGRLYIETRLLAGSQESEVKCSTGIFPTGRRAPSSLPLIIDLSPQKKLGDTFWNFQVFKNVRGLFMLNNKSLSMNGDALSFLKDEVTDLQIRELDEDRVRLQFVQESRGVKQTIIIEYDLVQNLDPSLVGS